MGWSMSQIRIDFVQLETMSRPLARIARELDDLRDELRAVARRLPPEVGETRELSQRLTSAAREADELYRGTVRLSGTVASGAKRYREAERRLARKVPN